VTTIYTKLFTPSTLRLDVQAALEKRDAEELSLPMFPDLTDAQVDQVVETLTKILR